MRFTIAFLFTFQATSKIVLSLKIGPVNGTQTLFLDAPDILYQISIQRNGRHICAGVIFDTKTVITAAHCMSGYLRVSDLNSLVFVAGDFDLSKNEETEQYHLAERILPHPNYKESYGHHNIAIVKLKTPIIFNRIIKAIPIFNEDPTSGKVKLAKASGWGIINRTQSVNDLVERPQYTILRKSNFTIFTTKECIFAYRNYPYIVNLIQFGGVFCAGDNVNNDGLCEGDGGSPLACYSSKSQENMLLCGIASLGIGCALREYPTIFTNVYFYANWIKTSALADE